MDIPATRGEPCGYIFLFTVNFSKYSSFVYIETWEFVTIGLQSPPMDFSPNPLLRCTTMALSADDRPTRDASTKDSKAFPLEESSPSLHDEDERDEGEDDENEILVNSSPKVATSRYFAPYRTVGIVCSGGSFDLMPHQNSAQAIVACPIQDRFQLLQTDRLHPVLISQALPTQEPQKCHHVLSDASLSITVVSHGTTRLNNVTLYHRTKPIASFPFGDAWEIQGMISMGRMPAQTVTTKTEKQETANVIVAVLAKVEVKNDRFPTVGEDDSSDDEEPLPEATSDSLADATPLGQIVVFMATRTSLSMHRRISLEALPTFRPSCVMHPATYLNKIVVGGSHDGAVAATLINIRSGKIVHNFQCFTRRKRDSSLLTSSWITTIEQSPAVDTVAMGTSHGFVYLLNLKLDQILFHVRHKDKQKTNVAVTSISFRTDAAALQFGVSPMAVGRSDGTISIWDLTPPEDPQLGRTILAEMHQVHIGGVAKLQYFPQEPLLLSTGTCSNAIFMHIFDRPDHSPRLLRQRQGHRAPPTCVRYLHAGGGAGNGLLVNLSDGTDARACQILSAGGPDRSLRLFSTVRSVLDKEYSQGPGLEKRARQMGLESTAELLLPPITGMSICEARSRDWGDLVTIHQDHALAYVWSTQQGAQTGPVLRQLHWNVSAMKQPPPVEAHATSVAMSACGSFALIGTKGGTIYRYNVQSGIARGSYPRLGTDSEENRDKKKTKAIGDVNRTMKAIEKTLKANTRSANLDKSRMDGAESARRDDVLRTKLRHASHTGYAVTGLAVDAINKTLISVGADAKLILWNFTTQAPHVKSPYMLPSPATKLCHVRESDLAAIAMSDYFVVLFDCSAISIVRRFGGASIGKGVPRHTAAITDLCFSSDGRILYTSSLDSTIRIWDVPTNKCVDWLAFKAPPTAMTISPTGEYLATTHVGNIGISVWSDKSFYQTVHIDGTNLTSPIYMDEPVPMGDSPFEAIPDNMTSTKSATAPSNASEETVSAPIKPKENGLITLSGLPVAHWKNLFHLELVKQRNKAQEPPKKPPSAPFFLQWRGDEPPPPVEASTTSSLNLKVPDEPAVDEEWAAAWSDDEAFDDSKKSNVVHGTISADSNDDVAFPAKRDVVKSVDFLNPKRRKVTHVRSYLASLLKECKEKATAAEGLKYQQVSEYLATLGPSAIDVTLSSLCNGMHDLEEGLPLLLLAADWLAEACRSRERFEAVNAYLHRFLFLHSFVFAGIKDGLNTDSSVDDASPRRNVDQMLAAISQLKLAQQSASDELRAKMDHTLCLLRHFSRMI
jgi:U3 small nucleolar RNA-associated protein 21